MGNELRCLQILSKEEINPEIRGDLRLLDCESADQSEVSISSSMLKRYQNALAALQSRVKSAAQSGGGSFYSISSNTDLSTVVFQTLRAAGVLA